MTYPFPYIAIHPALPDTWNFDAYISILRNYSDMIRTKKSRKFKKFESSTLYTHAGKGT